MQYVYDVVLSFLDREPGCKSIRTELIRLNLLSQPFTGGVQRYRKLFEDVIDGEAPCAELAIEYEIENLSLVLGPPFVQQCQRALGPGIMAGLSFVQQHVALDEGHTEFNADQLSRFLDAHHEYLAPMVAAGAEALEAYGDFVDDCYRLAGARSGVPI